MRSKFLAAFFYFSVVSWVYACYNELQARAEERKTAMAVKNYNNLFNAIHNGEKVIVRLMPDMNEENDTIFSYWDMNEEFAMRLACMCDEPSFKKAHQIFATFSYRWASVEVLKWAFANLEDMGFNIECYNGGYWSARY